MVNLIASINSLFWGSLLILLLVGTGIFFTIRLRFVQVRKFRKGITQLTGDFDLMVKMLTIMVCHHFKPWQQL